MRQVNEPQRAHGKPLPSRSATYRRTLYVAASELPYVYRGTRILTAPNAAWRVSNPLASGQIQIHFEVVT
jgi:hypothetical protein